jgi:hypothetical protein
LKLIIGPQPPVRIFHRKTFRTGSSWFFRRFINVFARPEHPRCSWTICNGLDAATLDKAVEMTVNFYAAHRKGWAQVRRIGDQG